jgi:hypothetical protein
VPEKNVGYYSPALAKRIRDNSFAWERERASRPVEIRQSTPDPIYFHNASTETIPPYGCVQMVGTEEIDGQFILRVDRPIDFTASVVGPFLLNGPTEVEANGLGTAQWGPIYRAISDGGAYSVGTRFGPVASSFELSKGPLFTYIGDDDLVEDCVRVIACETPLLAVAGGSGIAGNSSGTVTAKQPASGNWGAGTVTYTAWNPTGVAIGNNSLCLIYPVDAKWVALELC